MSKSIIQLDGVLKLREESVRLAVRDFLGAADDCAISDAAAATIASWYQSSGELGRAFAALASGAPVAKMDLYEDIVHELTLAHHRQGDEPITAESESMTLLALLHWSLTR